MDATPMTVCQHTGISVPECSCSACLRGLLETHMPATLESKPAAELAAPPAAEQQDQRAA